MVDAVLLELEGVVFDTQELRKSAVQAALREQGVPATTDHCDVFGLTTRATVVEALRRSGTSADVVQLDLIAMRADVFFSKELAVGRVSLRPGARDFIREAAATSRLAVVTRARRDDADALLRLGGLSEFITLSVAAEDVIDPKPSPEGYRIALERLKRNRPLQPGAAIALEDGAAGIRAARESGLRCIAVGRIEAHIAIEADAFVGSLAGQTVRSLDRLASPGPERVP
jgi:HAD superfamily hydrolase (TIGR01509 family)